MPKHKKDNDKKNIKRKKKISDDVNLIEDDFVDADEVSDDGPVIEEAEDDTEFLTQVKEFEQKHKNSKLINVYQLLGRPGILKLKKANNAQLKAEYEKLIMLLDKHNLIVHFQNDYSLDERYRFITEEIFKQDIEKNKHNSFIYEDFHPEMIDDEEEEI